MIKIQLGEKKVYHCAFCGYSLFNQISRINFECSQCKKINEVLLKK